MFLPLRFFQFWLVDSFNLFWRSWFHAITLLDEDLSVGLMFRLLLTPLFHDQSLVGLFLSFFFRLTRVLAGLLAYFLTSVLILFIALVWYLSPVLIFTGTLVPLIEARLAIPGLFLLALPVFIDTIGWVAKLTVFFGLGLFIEQVLFFPAKKVWQIYRPVDLWQATKLSKNISWSGLVSSHEVKLLLESLEIPQLQFSAQKIMVDQGLEDKIYQLARQSQAKYITARHFFVSILLSLPGIENELLKLNLLPSDFVQATVYLEQKRNTWRKVFLWDSDFGVAHLKGTNRGWVGTPTPNLDLSATDLTKEASQFGFAEFVGRAGVADEVVRILSQSQDCNVCLVGQPGSGRTALVRQLANRIIAGNAPPALASKRLVELDLTKLLSGVRTEGDLAQKVKDLFEEVEYSQNIILFVDEIQNFGLGDAGGSFNLYSLMLPFLESNKFQFISATEPESYARILEKNGWFSRIFNKVELPPASPEETSLILQNRSIDIERKEHLTFTFLALKTIVELAAKLDHARVLPDSALSVMNECQRLSQHGLVSSGVVKEVFSKRSNVPILSLDPGQKLQLLNLAERIHQQFIDQAEAVEAIARSLQRAATDLRDQDRPIGSFLFVGPTGVGKTELAKRLCEVYFNQPARGAPRSVPATDADNFFRFDMSEYQTQEAVTRLIGDSESRGELTEAIRNKPYALILLDEFEKADPKLLTIFLQVLDDGRLTDSGGKTIDFSNTIIIATSNAASLTIANGLKSGQTMEQLKPVVQAELLKIFKPELVNRFDEVVIFKPLDRSDLEKIVRLKLKSLQEKLKDQGYLIEFDPNVVTNLVIQGFDPVLGARPMRRLIQDKLEARLSQLMLEDKLTKGQLLTVDSSYLV